MPWWTYNASQPQRNFSFTTALHVDGSITFAYDAVSDPTSSPPALVDPSLPPTPRTWLVGLRQLGWMMDTDTANMGDWNTTRPGVYPPRGWVRTGQAITFCPLDTSMCLHPTQGALNARTLLALTAPNLTCAGVHNHSYTVTFTPLSTSTTTPSPPLPPFTTNASYDATTNSLQFYAPAVNASGTAGLTLFDVTANTTVHLSSPLTFTFGTGATPAPLTPLSLCGACGASNPYVCTADCSGAYFGDASLDTCGRCTGGATGLTPNLEINCAGTCGGGQGEGGDGGGGGGAVGPIANLTAVDCLCQQLFYPPPPHRLGPRRHWPGRLRRAHRLLRRQRLRPRSVRCSRHHSPAVHHAGPSARVPGVHPRPYGAAAAAVHRAWGGVRGESAAV